MRARGSITGPLIIIGLGIIFLLHAISPDFPLFDYFALYWPYLLIGWGMVALLEVSLRTWRGASVPVNGVSIGAWFVIVLICLGGLLANEARRPDTWWHNTDWARDFDNAFGDQHDYSINVTQRNVGAAPHIVIENFRGDAKIAGSDTSMLTVSGHKTVRAARDELADKADAETNVDVVQEGKNVIIRCNQGRAPYRTSVITNLDLSVPAGASMEIDGSMGDFEVNAVNGDLVLRSGNAGVRVADAGGNVTVETHRSDLVRCTNVKGTVDVRGHGSDIELDRVNGSVGINGDFTGTVSLRNLSQTAHVQNSRTDLQLASVPGEVRLDRGSLNIQNAAGPVRLNAHSTDVSLENVTNSVEISVDRGDVDLKPGRLPLGRIAVHSGAGNIELAIPAAAAFALTAVTDKGEIENDFGDSLKEKTSGRGARLEGTVGSGPNIDLVTGRGTVTVRKGNEESQSAVASAANIQ